MDATAIARLTEQVLAGGSADAAALRALLDTADGTPAFAALMTGATRLRDELVGRELRCCSILNAKAGNCPEDCSYCAQSRVSTNIDYARHPWLDDAEIDAAATSAAESGAGALGLVAAWKGLAPGAMTDMVCRSIARLKDHALRADASLGILPDAATARRLAAAGLTTYHHNLETARSFFPQTCTTHAWAERRRTLDHARAAGMRLCSGGIFGLGESSDQRVEFLEQLREVAPDSVPVNFFNPIPGSALEGRSPLPAGEALVVLAACRYALPDRSIMVCGGKEATFGERLAEVLDAGANGVMVGNYLTTSGTPGAYWQEAAAARGMAVTDGGC